MDLQCNDIFHVNMCDLTRCVHQSCQMRSVMGHVAMREWTTLSVQRETRPEWPARITLCRRYEIGVYRGEDGMLELFVDSKNDFLPKRLLSVITAIQIGLVRLFVIVQVQSHILL